MITHTNVIAEVYKVLDADTTLRNAQHLTSSGRIFNTPVRPAAFLGNAITLNLIPAQIRGEQSYEHEFLLRVNVYLSTLTDHSPDVVRADLISKRLQTLLNNAVLDSTEFGVLKITQEIPESFTGIGGLDGITAETVWTHSFIAIAQV